MSVKVMGLVWDYYPEGGGELITALKIADHADHYGGKIWPSIESLADLTRQSERSVQRHLKAMQERGWLEVMREGGRGPGATTTYRIPIERIPDGVEARKSDKLSPFGRVTPEAEKGDIRDKKGDTGVAQTVSKSNRQEPLEGRGAEAPSPVAQAFKAYADGVKAKYGGTYPPSAKANGQLANVVSRVGAPNAVAVVTFYLGSSNQFYAKVKHSLDYLVRDCERLYMDLQAAAGGAAVKPPTKSEVHLVREDGQISRRLQDYPIGDAEAIAKKALADYGRMVANLKPKYIDVIIGAARKRFTVDELRAVPA